MTDKSTDQLTGQLTEAYFQNLALLHAASFPGSRAWKAEEFQSLLSSEHVFCVPFPDVTVPDITVHDVTEPKESPSPSAIEFALGRVVLDEVELLLIAVHPDQQGQKRGTRLLHQFEQQAFAKGARHAQLEVAQDNHAAIALYTRSNWDITGQRRGYYARKGTAPVDAMLFSKQLTGN